MEEVARELLGQHLVRGEVILRITEVEAYGGPEDSASHCRFGRTPRNGPMWEAGGLAYVYLCYGLHQMLNVVTGPIDEGAAVLIRACEVLRGQEEVQARRRGVSQSRLLNGPGKVGQALGLDASLNGHPLFKKGGLELRLAPAPINVLTGPRVGIDFAQPEDRAALRRFGVADSPSLSHRRGLAASNPGIGLEANTQHCRN